MRGAIMKRAACVVALLFVGCGQRDKFAPGTKVVFCCPDRPGLLTVPAFTDNPDWMDRLRDVPVGTHGEIVGRLDAMKVFRPLMKEEIEACQELDRRGGLFMVHLRDGPLAGQALQVFAWNLRPE
jgi:hypothetical protein